MENYWLWSLTHTRVHAQLLQLCPTLCNTMYCGPPGSSVHGISQARILEWVVISSSRDLPDPGIKDLLYLLCWQVDSLESEISGF